MGIARQRIDDRIASENRADDDEGMDLDAPRVRTIEQGSKRVERAVESLREWFGGVQIPGIPAAAHLYEESVGIAFDGGVDDAGDVRAAGERRAEGIHPVGAELVSGGRCGCEEEQDCDESLHGPREL